MPSIHRWWDGRAGETNWLEVTRRPDIGANLKAPQTNEHGAEFWSYSLLNEVHDGDFVYHYDGNVQAITARSVAVGKVWESELIWAARGLSARSAKVIPHSRPGWFLGLEHFERLSTPVTLDAIRAKADALRSIRSSLLREVGDPLYFPFELGGRRPIRPMQGYMFKLPKAFLDLFGLAGVLPAAQRARSKQPLGEAYRQADELVAVSEAEPFAIDPALVERGVRGHAITQNLLAEYLTSVGVEPRSPRASEPNFDVAWRVGGTTFVAEVKSLTRENEEKQLRLGLGQVLRYANLMRRERPTVPALVIERPPTDLSWRHLCQELGVILAWPEVFADVLAPRSQTLS